jgi:hypothetical protein
MGKYKQNGSRNAKRGGKDTDVTAMFHKRGTYEYSRSWDDLMRAMSLPSTNVALYNEFSRAPSPPVDEQIMSIPLHVYRHEPHYCLCPDVWLARNRTSVVSIMHTYQEPLQRDLLVLCVFAHVEISALS